MRAQCAAAALDLPFFDLAGLLQPPRSRATDMQASRSSAERAGSTRARATTIPPIQSEAMPWAVARRGRPFSVRLRSRTLTMERKTVSKALRADLPLRATSVGRATMGQE